jgi:transcription elongation factor SPT4
MYLSLFLALLLLPSLPPSPAHISQRFLKEGCPNCDEFLRLQGSMDAIIDCTSQVFEGLITLADPSKSWVAKWQRLDGYVRGVYATKVSGVLPDEVVAVMEDEARIRYIPYVDLDKGEGGNVRRRMLTFEV